MQEEIIMESLKLTNTSATCDTATTKEVVDENPIKMSMTTTITPFNSWHFLEEYNRTKQYQIDCINNSMDDIANDDSCCANDRHNTNNEQIKKLKQYPIYCDWVKTLIKFNSDLAKIIDELQKKLNEREHVNCMNGNKHSGEVIENDSVCENGSTGVKLLNGNDENINKQRKYDELMDENENLKAQLTELESRVKMIEKERNALEEAAIDARVLILEVAERHDAIIKLKNELNEMEEQLKQKDVHIQFKDEIIKELRRERREVFKCPSPNRLTELSKTKLDSIEKVVDYVRYISRDATSEQSSIEEKDSQQLQDYLVSSTESSQIYGDTSQYEKELSREKSKVKELEEKISELKLKYDEVITENSVLRSKTSNLDRSGDQQQTGNQSKDHHTYSNIDSQIDNQLMDHQSMDMIAIKSYSTAAADKTHLANLIRTLKSELSTANAILKAKEDECMEIRRQLNQRNCELLDAGKRYMMLEKQCAAECETIKYLENSLKTYSDTIKCLEENQEHLKSQITESQNKMSNYKKILDDNRKLETDLKHQLTTISFLRNALEDHLKQSGSHHVNSAMFRRNLNTNGNKISNKLITSVAVAPAVPIKNDRYFNGTSSSQNNQNNSNSSSANVSSCNKTTATSQSFTISNQTAPIKSSWWRSNN